MSARRTRPEDIEAEILLAFSHPLRIRILRSLLESGCCQCELASRLHEHPVNVSRHLSILVRSGLLRVRKEGTKIYPEIVHREIAKILGLTHEIVRRTASTRVEEARSLQHVTSPRRTEERRTT